MLRALALVLSAVLPLAATAAAQTPVDYRLTFADHVHHIMDVEVTFRDVTADPLEIRMSRTSPGRYALHDFAKNVFDVRITGAGNRPLQAEQPDLHQWNARGHGGTVQVRYRVYGDRVDGTHFAVDADHAHINIPATLMWARTLETRPARVTLVAPSGVAWKAATQLFETNDPLSFTAPNLAYLLDSPIQFSPHVLHAFEVPGQGGGPAATIRLALHHTGTEDEAAEYARALEAITREQQAIFGELPAFEGGRYTFLATYRPGATGDGMEHRNSTILTSSGSIRASREGLLGTAAHELFHAWNVERIRPRSLEPFDFEDATVSGELWFAEGFTSYYGPLTLMRSGLAPLERTLGQFGAFVNAVTLSPGRRFRSAVDMSRLAAFVDGEATAYPTNWENTFLSYYTYGAALGLGLDLALRDLTDGRVSLDDVLRDLWRRFGKAPAPPGTVATPYTMADLRQSLARVSGNEGFANGFFDRYIEGRDVVPYERLLARAGLVLRPRRPGAAWMGDLPVTPGAEGATVTQSPRMGTPVFEAGIGDGDVLVRLGGRAVASAEDVTKALDGRAPGDTIDATIRRHGREQQVRIVLGADPRQELVTVESTGAAPTPEQRRFRDAWLGSRVARAKTARR